MDMIKVSATSRTSAVAGAIAGVVREHKHAEVQAIGAGAVNQAVKALVLATGYLKLDGIEASLNQMLALVRQYEALVASHAQDNEAIAILLLVA